jgi:hypothetical protein
MTALACWSDISSLVTLELLRFNPYIKLGTIRSRMRLTCYGFNVNPRALLSALTSLSIKEPFSRPSACV